MKFPLTPILVTLSCLCACNDDDLLTDAASQPAFELNQGNTQHLGILFPGHTTSTRKLLLYNRNSGAIELDSIVLRGGEKSLFRINVDGMAGNRFTDSDYLHIAKGDSLHILLEASFMDVQQEREVEHEDFIDLYCNSRLTSIRLAVTTLNVEELRNDTIRRDTLWAPGSTDKLLYGSLTIPEGVTLTIGSGLSLYLHDQAKIDVYGTLCLDGTLAQPVRLVGDRTDSIFSNLAYTDMSAQWDGINLFPSSQGSRFEYAEIMGMTSGIKLFGPDTNPAGSQTLGKAKGWSAKAAGTIMNSNSDDVPQLTLRNSLVKNCDASLISATGSSLIAENSLLMNSGGPLLELNGGSYDITHCTLANYQFWTAYPAYDLLLRNYSWEYPSTADEVGSSEQEPYKMPRPLHRCNVTNTLVYGNGAAPNVGIDYEGYFGSITATDSIFHYHFDHCLLKASGEDDDDFVQTVWNEDPLYLLVDMPNYICNPHLQPESPAIGKGNASTLERLPSDKDGKPRPTPPSIGCYEPE